ncbi:unnamed protein product [Cylicocyclus nassatus]|uniref:C2H2-type domain-containing protein n=1 Tax=Cylicocyclus nassatus TaxID=53992 RepID=A0AA36DNB5_CYLNA|nr:unnamed protein product [Cylicocyclus nassatus]
MTRRSAIKRTYTPENGHTLEANAGTHSPDSEGEEFIDVETVGSGQVRVTHHNVAPTTSLASRETTIPRRVSSRQVSSKFRTLLASVPVRSTPKITLVGRGRPESANRIAMKRPNEQCEQTPDDRLTTPPKRAPILANEGIGTYAIPKLPLEEMTMSTRVSKIHGDLEDEVEPRSELSTDKESKSVTPISAEPSSSSDDVPAAIPHEKSDSSSLLTCAQPHCFLTFNCLDDLISHLVEFHCQQQFRPRRMTFVSVEKYEVWKTAHEKAQDAKMIVGNREDCDGTVRFHCCCEYCHPLRQQLDELERQENGKSFRVKSTCPAHYVLSLNYEKNTATIFGCLAHIGHPKKPKTTSAADLPQKLLKTAQAKCKYCGKWCVSRVAMNRHVRDQHAEPSYTKGTTIECGDPDCDVVCDRMSTLCEHVAQEHGREDLVIEEFKFPNVSRFKEWKNQIETETVSKFVLSSSRARASGVLQSYFLCHLSGYANRSRHSAPPIGRMRTTKKMGRYCTAFMNTKEFKDGAVVVQCCLGHFGHGFDVRRLPLPDKVKDDVTDLLMKGASTQEIYDAVRRRYSQSERGYYLQRYEIRNIADKLRKQGLLPPKETEKHNNQFNDGHLSQMAKTEKSGASVQRVRFQSIRSLPDRQPGRIYQTTYGSSYAGSQSVVEQNHYDAISRMGPIRDVSPPIIGTSGYVEYQGSGYDEGEMIVGDEDNEGTITYFLEDEQNPGSLLEMVHSERVHADTDPPSTSKVTPLLMEPQPTGNVSFDETMNDIRIRITILQEQKRQTRNVEKVNMLVSQIRDLQGQLVRGVPQTNGFIRTTEAEFDGEEDGEDIGYEHIEGDDAICFEVEVESTESPDKSREPVSAEHYENTTFDTEPYEEVVTAGYEYC